MKKIKLFEQFVNEAKVDKKYFDKVVKVLSTSKYPFTIMLVTKWNEIDIVMVMMHLMLFQMTLIKN